MRLGEPITTPRLTLRDYTVQDLAFVLSLWLDPETGKYLADPTADGVDEEYLKALARLEDDPAGYELVLEEAGAPVGTCAVFPAGHDYAVSCVIAPTAQRKGLATEALAAVLARLTEKGARSAYAEAADENLPAGKLLTKSGFRQEKMSRFEKYKAGITYPSTVWRRMLNEAAPATAAEDDFPL